MEPHEFVAGDEGSVLCQYINTEDGLICLMERRAGIHLLTPAPVLDKQIVVTLTANGMNIAVNGDFDPSDYALIGTIISDMAIQALRAATIDPRRLTQDHKKKGGRN